MAHTPYCLSATSRTLNLPGGGMEPVVLAGQPVAINIALDAGEGVTVMVAIDSVGQADGEVVLLGIDGRTRWVFPISFVGLVGPIRLVPPSAIKQIQFNTAANGFAVYVRDGDIPTDKCSFNPGGG